MHHGDAGLINAAKASAVCEFVCWFFSHELFDLSSYKADWTDGGRDVANFLLHFLPSVATTTLLPVSLQQVPAKETSLRIQSGFKYRKFVAVGHSYGGCIA